MIIDIIIFAFIAAFIIYKLFNVLGQIDEEDRNIQNKSSNNSAKSGEIKFVGEKVAYDIEEEKRFKEVENSLIKTNDPKIKEKIAYIISFDKDFSEEYFLNGARYAFGTILKSFATADKDKLQKFTTHEIYEGMLKEISRREENFEDHHTDLIAIYSIEIIEINIQNSNVDIVVKIESNQINFVKNIRNGTIISGNEREEIIEDVWTFTRNLNNKDYNWYLKKL